MGRVRCAKRPRRGRACAWLAALACGLACLAGTALAQSCARAPLPAPVVPAPGFIQSCLSDYFSSLRGSPMDTPVFVQRGARPGGSLLVVGGTHPGEVAGYLAAIVLLENAQVAQGRLLIIPFANRSAFALAPGAERSPAPLAFTLRDGSVRSFPVGGRYADPALMPPDPASYVHKPSGQRYAGQEGRNLNRVYPGDPEGTPVEQLAFAIMQVLRQKKVALAVDLHEANPDSPIANTLIAHEKSMDLAVAAALDLSAAGIALKLEFSPHNMRGLSHREWGDMADADDARAVWPVLLETVNPGQGKDIDRRIARHVAAVDVLAQLLGTLRTTEGLVIEGLPAYQNILQHGAGAYLAPVVRP